MNMHDYVGIHSANKILSHFDVILKQQQQQQQNKNNNSKNNNNHNNKHSDKIYTKQCINYQQQHGLVIT